MAIELNLQRTIIYHWRYRFRTHGVEGLTSKRGRPRLPAVLAAVGMRAARTKADSLDQAQAKNVELERKVGQQQLDFPDADRSAILIRSGDTPPSTTYAAVRYGTRWYWVAEDDYQSKIAFTILQVLEAVAQSTSSNQAPVVTIPAN